MPDKVKFQLSDHNARERILRLPGSQAQALENALDRLEAHPNFRSRPDAEALPWFLLPLAERGLTAEQIVFLSLQVSPELPLDHARIYYDFRLGRWQAHLEPPTLGQCLDEYALNAESPEQGLAYVRKEWEAFLRRRGSRPG